MKILTDPTSGSVAGVTASRNRFGQYRRTRGIPVQPRSPRQTYNRALFAAGASAWRSLTEPQRTAWADYAAQILRTDALGQSYSPTGQELFTGSYLANAGAVTDPPVTLPGYVLSVSQVTYTDPTPGPEALTLSLDQTSADNRMTVETSGPVSDGITSAAAVRRWRSLGSLFASAYVMSASPVAILTDYKALFPSPLTGQVIWFRFRERFYDAISGAAPIVNDQRQTFRFVVP